MEQITLSSLKSNLFIVYKHKKTNKSLPEKRRKKKLLAIGSDNPAENIYVLWKISAGALVIWNWLLGKESCYNDIFLFTQMAT